MGGSHHPRLDQPPPAGHGRGGSGELDRGDEEGPLTDTDDQGLAGEPALLADPLRPLPGRQQTGQLPGHVHPGLGAEAEGGEEVVQAVDPHVVGQIVEVDVAGLDDGLLHGHGTVPPLAPVAIPVAVARQLVGPRAELAAGEGDGPGGQPAHGDERLGGGARRILAAHRSVEEGMVRIVAQIAVFLDTDPLDEGIGVEARVADHGQDAALTRVYGHHGATVVAQGGGGGLLQGDIQVQVEVPPGPRGLTLQHPQYSPLGIDLHLLIADPAAQDILVCLLDPALADVVESRCTRPRRSAPARAR